LFGFISLRPYLSFCSDTAWALSATVKLAMDC
jgi:hypothetical protein